MGRQIKKGSLEARILRIVQSRYPVTLAEVAKELRVTEKRTELAVRNLITQGVLVAEPLSDKTYLRVTSGFMVVGTAPEQKKALKHKGPKRGKIDDYEGNMYG